jgi:hypothetical protein
MRLGKRGSGAPVGLWALGVLWLGACGIAMAVLLHWLEARWPAEGRREIAEAERRPDRAHFRPIEGPVPLAALEGTTYVPVYSTLYLGDHEVQAGMAVTLSVRNTSPDHELVVHRIEYYDTAGQVTRRLADRPHTIPAMATAEFLIDRDDPVGGPGANYLVAWSVPEGGMAPLIEAVIVGRLGSTSISLVGRGLTLDPPQGRWSGTEKGSPP